MLTKLGLAALAATIGLAGFGNTASAHERDARVVVVSHDHDAGRNRLAHERIARARLQRMRYAQWQRARLRAQRLRLREQARRARILHARPYGVR